MNWINETFGTAKPIIAMCHFAALPGDPYYDKKKAAWKKLLSGQEKSSWICRKVEWTQ